MLEGVEVIELSDSVLEDFEDSQFESSQFGGQFEDRRDASADKLTLVRRELFAIRDMLTATH
jgi:hypothetical protein